MEDYSKRNRNDLILDCKQKGIKGYSTKTKSEIISLLNSKSCPLTPLVKWSGGKSDEIDQIKKYMPEQYDTYIEPFVGGGALYFHLSPAKAVINDIHKDLVAFYQCIANGKRTEIKQFMKDHPNDEKTYYQVRDNFSITTDIDRAKQFYYLRKTCFRGMLRYNSSGKMNIPYGRYKTINYSDLDNSEYEKLMARTTILNGSFESIFQKYNSPANFMFLDPPYDSTFTDYGYCSFGKEEHRRLATCFKETNIKCLMIIGKTDFILELYKDYIVAEYPKKYKFKLHSGRIGSEINVSHLVIKNY